MPSPPSKATAVVAEKPSVARDIADVLGANKRSDGYRHGNGYIVTWAIGHLVALAQPHEINPQWRAWRRGALPILPPEWPLVVYEQTRQQFEIVSKIINSEKVGRVVAATDAGREGELIFRYIYEAARCAKPVERLWISSLTAEAIRDGFARLRPGKEFEPLAHAARARSRADWLVGMNLSRAYSLDYNQDLSVGRVQTPTLAMLVERELAIRRFVAEDYIEVVAAFSVPTAERPKEDAEAAGRPVTYEGTFFRPAEPKTSAPEQASNDTKDSERRNTRLPPDGEEAARVIERAKTGAARVESVERETKRLPPPLFYDLTELQRHGNRLFGFSATRTLEIAQALYEKYKLLTYPRTDSRHLSADVAATLPRVVKAIAEPYRTLLAPGTGERPLGKRFVDDAKVTDHHAIIPTGGSAKSLPPGSDEAKLYDLVCRRLLSAWHEDHVFAVTNVVTAITSRPEDAAAEPVVDRYWSSGTAIEQQGWKVLDPISARKARAPTSSSRSKGVQENTDSSIPAGLTNGLPVEVADARAVSKRTQPPRRFTEATLLTAMESAGRTLDDKELSDAMKDRGLGTPATRAAIIETLLRRQYVTRKGKSLEATDKGIRLIEVVHPAVKSPAMTGEWEASLKLMERGKADFDAFMRRIEEYIKEVVTSGPPSASLEAGGERPVRTQAAAVGSAGARQSLARDASLPGTESPPIKTGQPGGVAHTKPATRTAQSRLAFDTSSGPAATSPPARPSETVAAEVPSAANWQQPPVNGAPYAGGDLLPLLKKTFGFESFRPHQEEVCRAVAEGNDVLLVMPTGAGKSLCYQLPGIARGGVTLVVSPLIALMEDQVAKLRERGLRAERIHSGRGRAESRQVCIDYLAGRLQFLFIAPERLAVPGFPEMLAKRKPSLIAVDEAHCISQWGHDFRPEYRMLGQRLPMLRPAPVIGLTATATPLVQDDIVEQLGLNESLRRIHGFRRDNIAIEVVELLPSVRPQAARSLLQDPGSRPAIIYAPTRKSAEDLAGRLQTEFAAAAYHAGMGSGERDAVQVDFLADRYEIVVATIAFGMGIDKPNIRTVVHTALPGSIEAYYQEIGRAGRDGKPSRAVLMHSWIDRRTHEFFHEKDYPDPEELQALFAVLKEGMEPKEAVVARVGSKVGDFDKALEKLWIHGGALVDSEDRVGRGHDQWRSDYLRQRDHKILQLDHISRYAESHGCRMLALVGHFGDQEDSRLPCGICDICAPDTCRVQQYREPSATEARALEAIAGALRERDGQTPGKLYAELFDESECDRRGFERLVGGLARAGFLKLASDSFSKQGKRIEFRRIWLTHEGRHAQDETAAFVRLPVEVAAIRKPRKDKPRKGKPRGAKGKAAAGGQEPAAELAVADAPERTDVSDPRLAAALKEWRSREAKRYGVPAFRILHDRTLAAIAAARPASAKALLSVHGLGPKMVEKYGAKILAIVDKTRAE